MVARGAGQDAAAAGQIGGEHAADRGLPRRAAQGRSEIDRLEGKLLAALGEHALDLGERRAGGGRQHKLGRLVERDADETLGAHHRASLHQASHLMLGAAPPHLDGDLRLRGLGQQVGDLAHRLRRMEAEP